MKKLIVILLLSTACSLQGQAQKTDVIDNKNYYNYAKFMVNFDWLRMSDAVPIIIDELLKNGIAYHTINIGDLIKINDSTRLVVTIAFEKGEKNYGFVYETGHSIPLNPEDRDFLTDRKKASYLQTEVDLKHKANWMVIKPLPNNIFLLKQTCYWFEMDATVAKKTVSKEVAQTILRQDIKEYLKNL